jgi:hypothetical protein
MATLLKGVADQHRGDSEQSEKSQRCHEVLILARDGLLSCLHATAPQFEFFSCHCSYPFCDAASRLRR